MSSAVTTAERREASLPLLATLNAMPAGHVFAARYRIDRLLGTGGMGAVYQAWDRELDAPVALKVIRPEITGDPGVAHEFEQRFKQELLLARQVTHRNVVRIHDLGESSGVKYLTMQLVEGTELTTILRQGKLPFDRVLELAKQLVAGVAAAHDVGVVHRDLKPQNILVDAADHLYVSDFGLAKSLESTLVDLTRTGAFMGTARYAAPEQVEGRPIDHRTDLYAVGLILFEMATGDSAFAGNSAIEMMFQRLQQPPRDPKLLAPDLPEYFCRIILRCLARDPEARYETAHGVLRDLDSKSASPARFTSRPRIVAPRLSPRRAGIGLAAVLVIGILAAVPAVRQYVTALGENESAAPAAVEAVRHVAVLPFQVAGEAAAIGHIAGGIEEALTAKLFQLSAVNVASAAAVERAAAKDSLAAIARDLGVTLVVSGAVRGTADEIRITVTLDDTAAGTRLWAQDFSGVPGDLLTIEDQIYSGLLGALDLAPSSEELARAISHPTENIEAYQLYLRGRNALRGQQNPKSVEAAIAFFERAVSQDPTFARAYAGISDAGLRMFRVTRDASWADRALSSALQARALDESLVEVRMALGSAYQATGKTTEAIAELALAAQLAPNSDDVYRRLARAYLSIGRGAEAIAAYDRAIAINPYYWVSYAAVGVALMQLGHMDAAIERFQKVIELEPSNVSGHNDLGALYLQTGRFDEAAASFQRALALQPTAQTYTNLGIAYAYAGSHADAIPMFQEAVTLTPNSHIFIGNLGDGYRWAGDSPNAQAAYDTAIALALKELRVNPRNAEARGNIALYYAKKGDHARARKDMASAREIDAANVTMMYSEAVIDALAGRIPQALEALEQAVGAGYPLSAARYDPDLASLREEPAFEQLAAKSGAN